MTAPTIYHYDPVTGIYSGASAADPSPLEPGVYLLPACATFTAPPTPTAGMVAKFSAGQWIDEAQPTIPTPVSTNDPNAGVKAQLAALDAFLPRGTEDVIAALVAKGTIALTDLPAVQQSRLSQKQALRAQLAATT